MVQILRIDPVHAPETVPFTGIVAQRVHEYAKAHQPDQAPVSVQAGVLAALWSGARELLVLVLVEDNAIVGHVVAQKVGTFAQVFQIRADKNVGGAIPEALHAVEAWARELGAPGIAIVSHKNPQVYEKLGYRPSQWIALKIFERGDDA